MQRWDYMVVRTYGGVVVLVDDKEVAQWVDNQPLGEMLYEFLDGLGRDGWDLVGMAGNRGGLDLILKRPLELSEAEAEELEELEE